MKSLKEALVHKHMDRSFENTRKGRLKTGDVCITKDKHYMVYVSQEDARKMGYHRLGGTFITVSHSTDSISVSNGLEGWDDDLNHNDSADSGWDIIKVIKPKPGKANDYVNKKCKATEYIRDVLGCDF